MQAGCWQRHRQRLRACDRRCGRLRRSRKAERKGRGEDHFAMLLAFMNLAGPAATALIILALQSFYILFFFRHCTCETARLLKISGWSWGVAGMALVFLCNRVSPGSPQRVESDQLLPSPPGGLGQPDGHDVRCEGHGEADDEGAGEEPVYARRQLHANGTFWTQKFCRDCRLWRPHRCGHCRHCGYCVLRLDHHCIFTGGCIGQDNLRFFVAFLVCVGVAMSHPIVCWKFGCPGLDHTLGHGDWLLSIFRGMLPGFVPWLAVLYYLLFITFAGVLFVGVGFVYLVALLADIDQSVHGSAFWRRISGACRQLRQLAGCPGVGVYVLRPIRWRQPKWSFPPP